MAKLEEIEGIGSVYAEKLRSAGITTTDDLLEKGKTPAGRDKIAADADVSGKLLLEWVNHCDLFRINGVASEYADLLEAAGVDTVPELAQRNAQNLFEKLQETNDAKNLVRTLPSEKDVEGWVNQAKDLPRVIEY